VLSQRSTEASQSTTGSLLLLLLGGMHG